MPTYLIPIAYRGAEGRVEANLIIAGTYTDLTAAPTVVNGILRFGTSGKDLELTTGQQAADAFSFELDEMAIETQDDIDCATYILEGQNSALDPAMKRFVGITLQPSDPVEPEDFEYRGIILPSMSGTGQTWSGEEYDPDPSPVRNWKIETSSLDVAELIDKKLESTDEEDGLFDLIDSTWRDANVADRMGFMYEDNGPYGDREGRYADMVSFGTLIQKLLDLATDGTGVTITFEADAPDFYVWPVSVRLLGNNKSEEDAAKTRYGMPYWVDLLGDSLPSPYYFHSSHKPLALNLNPGTTNGHMFVNWKCVRPEPDAKEYAWGRADTLSNLIYGLAFNLGMLIVWEYVDNETITLRFRSRRNMVTTASALFIPDATADSLDVTPPEAEKGELFGGFANHMCLEGLNAAYKHDGGFVRSPEFKDVTGDPLFLTVSPAWCWLDKMGQDAGRKPGEETPLPGALQDARGGVCMLQNAVFWDSHTERSDRAESGLHLDHNLSGLHTGMYIRFEDSGFEAESNGTDAMDCVRPVGAIVVSRGGEYVIFDKMADYLNYLYGIDESAFSAERELQVPYLTRFRETAEGSEDWRYCRLGAITDLDDRDWSVIGIERDYVGGTTKLRLHHSSRFAFDEVGDVVLSPSLSEPPPPSVGPSNDTLTNVATVQSFPAGAAIEQYAAVFVWPDGTVNQAEPDSYSFTRVIGIALEPAVEGDLVRILTDGPLHLDAEYDLTPGWPLVLRQSGHADAALANLSTVPRREATEDEYLHYPLGTVQTPRLITINIGRPFFLKEDVLQVDLSGGYEV